MLEDLDEAGVRVEHRRARDARRVLGAVALAHVLPELEVGGEVHEPGLDAVVVARPGLLGRPDVLAEPPRGLRVEVEAVLLLVPRLRGQVGERVQVPHHLVDHGLAVEGLALPLRRESRASRTAPTRRGAAGPPARSPGPRRRSARSATRAAATGARLRAGPRAAPAATGRTPARRAARRRPRSAPRSADRRAPRRAARAAARRRSRGWC